MVYAAIYAFAAPALVAAELWVVWLVGYEAPGRTKAGVWAGGSVGVFAGSLFAALAELLVALYPGALLYNVVFAAMGGGLGATVGFLGGRLLDAITHRALTGAPRS